MANQDKNRNKQRRATDRPANLPVVTSASCPRSALFRHKVPADFLSQLIAERNRMAAQREKRRAPASVAASVYSASGRIARPLMPAGYGHTQTV